MSDRTEAIPTGRVLRGLVLTFAGVTLFAGGLTFLSLGMRSTMDVGGYCASGGPYVIQQECPSPALFIPLAILAGLIGIGLVGAGRLSGGPDLWTLSWPALFLGLGWNFLEYAIDPPDRAGSVVWGWLICAVTFGLIGGVPVWVMRKDWRATLWGEDERAPAAWMSSLKMPRIARIPRMGAVLVTSSESAPDGSASPRPTSSRSTGSGDLVGDLERLATLHRSGALSDDEYEAAKASRLEEDQS